MSDSRADSNGRPTSDALRSPAVAPHGASLARETAFASGSREPRPATPGGDRAAALPQGEPAPVRESEGEAARPPGGLGDLGWRMAMSMTLSLPDVSEDRVLDEGRRPCELSLLAADAARISRIAMDTESQASFADPLADLDQQSHDLPTHEMVLNPGKLVTLGDFAPTVELTYATTAGGDRPTLLVTPGVLWRPAGSWSVGLGLPIGLTEESDRWGAVGLFTFEFGGKAD